MRPWYGVLVASVIVLLVFEASRRVAGLALLLIVLALCAHALLGCLLPEQLRRRSGRAQSPGRLSRRRHQRAARRAVADRRHRRHALRGHGLNPGALRRIGLLCRPRRLADGSFSRRRRQDRGGRLRLLRHGVGQRGRQCRERRHHHHSADETRRLPAAHRRVGRSGRLDRRPGRAAGDGRGRVPDGRVSPGSVWPGGARRRHSRLSVLRLAVHPGRSRIGAPRHPRRAARQPAVDRQSAARRLDLPDSLHRPGGRAVVVESGSRIRGDHRHRGADRPRPRRSAQGPAHVDSARSSAIVVGRRRDRRHRRHHRDRGHPDRRNEPDRRHLLADAATADHQRRQPRPAAGDHRDSPPSFSACRCRPSAST